MGKINTRLYVLCFDSKSIEKPYEKGNHSSTGSHQKPLQNKPRMLYSPSLLRQLLSLFGQILNIVL